jgi:hypothetical protein
VFYFNGFFVKSPVEPPLTLPEGAILREIREPFCGIGVRLSGDVEDQPSEETIAAMREWASTSSSWLHIDYFCWGGSLECVYGYGMRDGQTFGPIGETDHDLQDEARVKACYISLMKAFGVGEPDARWFPPFVHGFWTQ